jgi:hypothetical protein
VARTSGRDDVSADRGGVVGLMLGTAMYVGVMATVALIQSLAVVLLIDLFRMPQRVPPRS